MRRAVLLEYHITKLAEYDDEEYEQVGTVNNVHRETQAAVLVNVIDWQQEVWFPRARLRIDDNNVIWCEREFFRKKERERV